MTGGMTGPLGSTRLGQGQLRGALGAGPAAWAADVVAQQPDGGRPSEEGDVADGGVLKPASGWRFLGMLDQGTRQVADLVPAT